MIATTATAVTIHHITNRDGCPLHYFLSTLDPPPENPGPVLVFTHGAGCDHTMFDTQAPYFASHGFRVITWDVRCHGLSQPDSPTTCDACPFSLPLVIEDLAHVLDDAGVDSDEAIVVAGTSMGGMVAQNWLQAYPARTRAVIAMDCTSTTLPLTVLERWSLSAGTALLWMFPWSILKQAVADSSVDQAMYEVLLRSVERISKAQFVKIMQGVSKAVVEDKEYVVRDVPELLLVGEKDQLGNILKSMKAWDERDRVVGGNGKCIFKVIKGAGHSSNMDRPEEVNHEIIQFLKNTVGMRADIFDVDNSST